MTNMGTEYQFHELSYMQSSLELANVKEQIEVLMRDRHIIEKKIEEKTHEQNDLTEKCVRHLRVLRKKGMTADFYCPKKRGITATPTKQYPVGYAPNYIPSPRSLMSALAHASYGKTSTPVFPRGGLIQSYPFRGPSPQKEAFNAPIFGPGMYSESTPSGSRFMSEHSPMYQKSSLGVTSNQNWGQQLPVVDKTKGASSGQIPQPTITRAGGMYAGSFPSCSETVSPINVKPSAADDEMTDTELLAYYDKDDGTDAKILQGGNGPAASSNTSVETHSSNGNRGTELDKPLDVMAGEESESEVQGSNDVGGCADRPSPASGLQNVKRQILT